MFTEWGLSLHSSTVQAMPAGLGHWDPRPHLNEPLAKERSISMNCTVGGKPERSEPSVD